MAAMVEAKAVPKEAALTAVRMVAAKVEARAVLKEAALTGVWKAAERVEARVVLKEVARAIHKVRNTTDSWPE